MSLLILQNHLDLELVHRFDMKNYFVGIFFFLLSSFYTYAQIVYIDVNYILNRSEVGKSLNIYIKKIRDENMISYKNI